MKRTTKRLLLNRETIRALDDVALTAVVGGLADAGPAQARQATLAMGQVGGEQLISRYCPPPSTTTNSMQNMSLTGP